MFTRLVRPFRRSTRKPRRNRRSPLASRHLLAEALEDRTLLTTDLVSVAAFSPSWGNGDSYFPSINADGRYVAFTSRATNLVAGEAYGSRSVFGDWNVFVRDVQANATIGVTRDGSGDHASISADGRYVVFDSDATNLVPGDTNRVRDVFVWERQTNKTMPVTFESKGSHGNGPSYFSSISADGRYVAFTSDATNMIPGDTNGVGDIFVRDLPTNTTTCVSLDSGGNQGNGPSYFPVISADGAFVVFVSSAGNLVPDDTNGIPDVFVRDLHAGVTTRVNLDSSGNQVESQGFTGSGPPSISADGRFVAFPSWASNLVPGDTNDRLDVFVRDRQTNFTVRVSLDSLGRQGNGDSAAPSISADGRYVAFISGARNLVPGDTNGAWDVFLRDLQTNTTTCVSVDSDGSQRDTDSDVPSLSSGRTERGLPKSPDVPQ